MEPAEAQGVDTVYEAFTSYCHIGGGSSLPGQPVKMSLSTFTKVVTDLGILEPQGKETSSLSSCDLDTKLTRAHALTHSHTHTHVNTCMTCM